MTSMMDSDESEAEFLLKEKNKKTTDIEMGYISFKNDSDNHIGGKFASDFTFRKNDIIKENNDIYNSEAETLIPLAEEDFTDDNGMITDNGINDDNSKTAIYNTELFKCIKRDLVKSAKYNLDSGANPNATCHLRRISICHMAAYFGSHQILALLLRRGANPFRRDSLGRTPLHFAAWRGRSTCLLILLKYAFPSAAERKKFIEAAEGVSDSPDPLWLDSPHLHNCVGTTFSVSSVKCKETALQLALAQLNLDCARYLLEAGARICTCKSKAYQDDAQFCPSTMNACGSALNDKDLTVDERYVESIKMLIEHGKGQNKTSNRRLCQGFYIPSGNQRTALHNTALIENGEATKLLLNIGFDSQKVDISKEAPIHYTVKYQKITALQHLVEASDINIDMLQSVFVQAIIKSWTPGVRIILNALTKMNANIDRKYGNGNTALHLAAGIGNQSLVNMLIASFRTRHFSIDMKNHSGYTPLHKAVQSGAASCVRVLLHQGAAFDIELHNGQNVLHLAAKNGDHLVLAELLETTKLFEESAEFISKKDNDGLSPLHWASYNNSYKCLKLLFEAGANLFTLGAEGNFHGFTVLHMAAINDSVNIVRMIFTINRPMIKATDAEELTPFHRAIINGHRETSTLFLLQGADLSDEICVRGKQNSIVEIISKNWRNPREYLKELFDMHIVKNEFNLDDARCVVTLNYSIFTPPNKGRMKIFEKMFGKELGFDQLLLHPLVESFLHLEWRRLRKFFFGIVAMYATFLFFITCLLIDMYDNNQHSTIWEICCWINIILITIMESSLIKESKSVRYLTESECIAKVIFLFLALWLLLDCRAVIDRGKEFSRALAALAILAAWTQLGIQFSRLIGGFYFQMFTRVAVRVAKVMILFGWFPIVGFSLAFWILFSGNTPFDTWQDSIVKTIVMMTSEFDYSSIFEDKPFNLFWIIARIIFLAYIGSVSIVLINLLMALAITGTKDLKVEGKTQRLLQQVHFLGTLDGFAFNIVWRVLPKFISKNIPKEKFSQLTLHPGRIGIWKWSNTSISEGFATKIFKHLSKRNNSQQNFDDSLLIDEEKLRLWKKEIFHECAEAFSSHMEILNKRLDDMTGLLKQHSSHSRRRLKTNIKRKKRKI